MLVSMSQSAVYTDNRHSFETVHTIKSYFFIQLNTVKLSVVKIGLPSFFYTSGNTIPEFWCLTLRNINLFSIKPLLHLTKEAKAKKISKLVNWQSFD